jgi:ribosomal protein S19E (S16A)
LPYFGRNELSRLVLATLRTAADEPIGIEEISRRITTAKGLDARDVTLRAAIRQRLRTILTRLRKQGVIEAVSSGRGSKWKLAGA